MRIFRALPAAVLSLCLLAGGAQAQGPGSDFLGRLHDALNLTQAQEESWTTFEHAYAVDPQEMARRRDAAASMAGLAAPQRVDLSISLAKADLDALEHRGDALKIFYGTLTPAQQKIFDRETLLPDQ